MLGIIERIGQAIGRKTPEVAQPTLAVRMLEAASASDLRSTKFVAAVRELQELPHYSYSTLNPKTRKQEVVVDRIAAVIVKLPDLIKNTQVQKLLLDVIDTNLKNWKDHLTVYRLLSGIAPAITPQFLNTCSSEALSFIGILRTEYLNATKKTLNTLQSAFKDDLHVKYGYNGQLPPGLKSRLKTIRKLTREFENSNFGIYEESIISDLKKTKSKWNRAVMPRLLNIKEFRRDFKKLEGRFYGQKNPPQEIDRKPRLVN